MSEPAMGLQDNIWVVESAKLFGTLAVGIVVGLFLRRRQVAVTLVSVQPSAKVNIQGYVTDLPEELLQPLNKCHWSSVGRRFTRREDIATLYGQVRTLRAFYKASAFARQRVDEIIDRLQMQLEPTSLSQLVHELVSNRILGRMIQGMAKRQSLDLPEVPEKTEGLEKPLIPYYCVFTNSNMTAGYFMLAFAESQYRLPFEDPDEQHYLHRLAVLLSSPEQQQLLANLRSLREELLTDIELSSQIIDGLEPRLFRKSRWLVTVQFNNTGPSPVAIGSSGHLLTKCGDDSFEEIDLVFTPDVQEEQFRRGPSEDASERKLSQMERDILHFGEALEPMVGATTENIVLGPGESRRVALISGRAIEEYAGADRLLQFWENSMPRYRVQMELIPKSRVKGGYVKSVWLRT